MNDCSHVLPWHRVPGLSHWPLTLASYTGLLHWPLTLASYTGLLYWPLTLASYTGLLHWPLTLPFQGGKLGRPDSATDLWLVLPPLAPPQKSYIMSVPENYKFTPVLQRLHRLPVRQRVIYKLCLQVFWCLHGTAPSYLMELLHLHTRDRRLRPASLLQLAPCRSKRGVGRAGFRSCCWPCCLEHSVSQFASSRFTAGLQEAAKNLPVAVNILVTVNPVKGYWPPICLLVWTPELLIW